MNESNIINVTRLPDGTVVQEMPDGKTRWARVEAMTEEEIEANALADPDNPPMTPEELARIRSVPNARRIRERLQLTQEEFSFRFGVPLGTLRDWEQGASFPDSAARTLLRVIDNEPDAVIRALQS